MPSYAYDNLKSGFDPLSPLLRFYKKPSVIRDAVPFHVTGILDSCDDKGFLSFSLFRPRFCIGDLTLATNEHYGTDFTNGVLVPVQKSKMAMGGTYIVRLPVDGSFYRCRLIDVKAEFAFVRLLDFDYEVDVDLDLIYPIDKKFLTNEYKYSLCIPAYTLNSSSLASIGLPDISKVKAGSVMDFLVLNAGFRCLVLCAPHKFGLFRFSGQRLRYNSALDEKWVNLISEVMPQKKFDGKCYPQMKPRMGKNWNFGQIMSVDSLDNVYVRDLQSCIRVFFIQNRLQQLFNSVEFKSQFQVKEGDEFLLDHPCVFYDSDTKTYYRGKITNITDQFFDAMGLDYPSKKIFGGSVSSGVLYHLPEGLEFPSTVYPVKLTNQFKMAEFQRYNQLLQGLLVENTPVTFKPGMNHGIVEMRLLDQTDVLAEIQFHSGDDLAGITFGDTLNKSLGHAESFKSSLSKWEAMDLMDPSKTAEKKKKKKTIASVFETSLPPRKPEKKGPPKGCEEVGYVFSDGYNWICYRTHIQEALFNQLHTAINTAVKLNELTEECTPTVGEHYLIKIPLDNFIYRAVIRNFENGYIKYFCVDSGMMFRQQLSTLRNAIMPLSKASSEFSMEKVGGLVEGPFKMAGKISEDEGNRFKHMKLKAALRCALTEMGTVYIKRSDEGLYVYNREGESINDYYINTMNKY